MEKSNKDKGLLSNIINIYNLIQSALDIVEKDDTETSKEVAGYLYTMMDNISDMDSNNKLGLALESKRIKVEGYEKVNAPSDAMITAVQKVVDSLDKNNLLDENTFQLECLKQYKEEAQLDKLASTKEREQVKQLAMEQYKQLKKEIRLAKKQQEEELNKEDSDMENKEVPVKENKELKTESKSIKEEYKDFCNDLGIDENKESSKTKFLNNYSRNYVKINGLKNVSEELKRIKEELNKDLEESKLTESKETVLASITPEIENNFNKLKEIIDSKENKVEVDGYYFTGRAVEILKNTDKEINLNSYMNLTVFDILNMIEDNDTVQEVVEELYEDYKEDSADTWANNFIEVMDKLNFDTTEEEELYEDKKLTPEDEAHYEEENDKLARQEVEDMLKNDKKEPDEEIEKELDNIKEDKELSPNMDNVEVYVNKNQFGYTTIGILVDDVNMRYALVDGQTLPIGKYKNLPKSKIRAMADELDAKGYEKIKMYGSLEESKLTEVKSNEELEKEFGMGWAQLPDRFIGNIYDFISQWYEEDPEELEDMEPEDILDQFKDEHGLDAEDIETYEDWYITYIQYTLNKVMGNKNKEELDESKKVTESNTIVNDENIDAVKDNFTPPGASKKTEAEEDDKRDEEIFNKMKEEPEEKTLLDMLQDRVGQKISVGEINSVLQSLFAKYDTIFIKTSELYNYEPDEEIETVIWDDEDMYTIKYHVTDLDYKTIEIDDVDLD